MHVNNFFQNVNKFYHIHCYNDFLVFQGTVYILAFKTIDLRNLHI